ncbi:MAG: hypothetical protein OHK0012_27770 [Synechococcales cyanobacterium]
MKAALIALVLGVSSSALSLAALPSRAQQTSQETGQPPRLEAPAPETQLHFNAEAGVAINGTDVVAYFRQGRPTPGIPEFAYEWQGSRWLFASAENRDLFIGDPLRFAPQFGGYCAYAVSQGYTAPIDPNAWSIVDGKLYLNLSPQVQRIWDRDRPGFIASANRNWGGILQGLLKQ